MLHQSLWHQFIKNSDHYIHSNRIATALVALVVADINTNQLKADANYQAVQEQSGLFAGDDGYEVTVGKNTKLVGGAIVSDAKAANNNLSTDSLEVVNLQNRASYKVDAKSISMSTSSTSSASDGKVGLGGGFAKDSATAQNTTHSVISEGTLTVRSDPNFIPDNTLKRNQQQAHQILGKLFGEDKIQEAQEHLEVTQLFAEEAYRAVGDLYQQQENAEAKAQAARQAYEKGDISKQNLDAFEQSAEDAKGNLPDKAITHALVGGITALLGGGDFIQGAMAAGLNELAAQQLKDQLPEDPLLKNMVASLIGGAVGGSQGAIIAGNADKFNRQLHLTEIDWIKQNAKEFAKQQGISEEQAKERLTQQALKEVDYLWRAQLADGDDQSALTYLQSSEQTFTNDLDNVQQLFTAQGQQLLRPEMFAANADLKFYQTYAHSGINRRLNEGLLKELKDSGIDMTQSVVELGHALIDKPGVVLDALWEGIKDLPKSVVEGFEESFNAIGEGVAVTQDEALIDSINALYNNDVETAQKVILTLRLATTITGGTLLAKAGKDVVQTTAKATIKKLKKVVKSVNKAKALKTLNIQKQVVDLFNKAKPNNQITIGDKILTALPKSGGAKVFKGASDRQIKNYFKQLTGSTKLPKVEKFTIDYNGKTHTGNMYRITDKNGNQFTLRDLSSSKFKHGTTEKWTIDINKGALGNKKRLEIKFK